MTRYWGAVPLVSLEIEEKSNVDLLQTAVGYEYYVRVVGVSTLVSVRTGSGTRYAHQSVLYHNLVHAP